MPQLQRVWIDSISRMRPVPHRNSLSRCPKSIRRCVDLGRSCALRSTWQEVNNWRKGNGFASVDYLVRYGECCRGQSNDLSVGSREAAGKVGTRERSGDVAASGSSNESKGVWGTMGKRKVSMQQKMKALIEAVSAWPGVSIHDHQFDGVEFRVSGREIGHIHWFGIVDIPFTVKVRDALIRAGRAERHQWLPDSGWTTVRVNEQWTENARELLWLSYLRVLSKNADRTIADKAKAELLLCGLEQEILVAAGVVLELVRKPERILCAHPTFEEVSNPSHDFETALASE